jgi:DNA-binding NtrC family response regulator
MSRIRNLLERVAPRDTTVLITGEAGTGKKLLARALHQKSARRDRPFIAVDRIALNDRGLRYELPGSDKRDAFDELYEMAQDSTMFLERVGGFAWDLQSKFLYLIQTNFQTVAGSTSHPSRVRFIAATARDLAEEVNVGRFREDLYRRLAVVTIDLPPLREHKEDIPLLADYFIQCLAKGLQASHHRAVAERRRISVEI